MMNASMTRPSLRCLGVAVLTISCFAAGASAAADDDAEKLSERLERITEELVERYRALDTYSDRMEMRYNVEFAEDPPMWGMDAFPTQHAELTFAAPNRIALRSHGIGVYCDGEHLWFVVEDYGQYRRLPAPASFDEILDQADSHTKWLFTQHPVITIMLRGHARLEQQQSNVREVLAIEEDDDLIRITALLEYADDDFDVDETVPTVIELDAQTHLVHQITFDMTDFYNTMIREHMAGEAFMALPEYQRFEVVQRVIDPKPNQPVEEAVFTFDHEEAMELVDAFESFDFTDPSRADQLAMIGEPAPPVGGPTLDGEELALEDLRGNVVLLDFWAMWCPPCVRALPHFQNLAERFEDEPLVVLGINRDPAGSEEQLKSFLNDREVTFRQVLDFNGDLAEAFYVTGIPCAVLIDKNGVVQDISTGFSPDKEDQLALSIERLLAGETLYSEEALEQLRLAAEEGDMFGDKRARAAAERIAAAVDEAIGAAPNVLRRLDGHRPAAHGGEWNARRIDLHGDGRHHLVMSTFNGGLTIVSPDGTETTNVQFSGVQGLSMIEAYEPIHIDGKPHWIMGTEIGGWGWQPSRLVVGLFDDTGRDIWTAQIDMPEQIMATVYGIGVGDISGNGRAEIIVSVNFTELDGPDGRQFGGERDYLLVYDLSGNLIAQQPIGEHAGAISVQPAQNGRPGVVIIIENGRVSRYTLEAMAM